MKNPITATTIKSPLMNKMQKMIGIIGLSFIQQKSFSVLPALTSQDLTHNGDFKKLSTRQRECLLYLSKGMSVKQIAAILHISPRTVEE